MTSTMSIKPGVRVLGIRPELVLALQIAQAIYAERSAPLVITSIIDSTHEVGSLHYAGCAADLRLPPDNALAVVVALHDALGPDFDVVLEGDHVHLEWQPKTPY